MMFGMHNAPLASKQASKQASLVSGLLFNTVNPWHHFIQENDAFSALSLVLKKNKSVAILVGNAFSALYLSRKAVA